MTEKCDKKKYEKPDLRPIELAADEVLGVGCKTNTSFFITFSLAA